MFNLITVTSLIIILVAISMGRDSKLALALLFFVIIVDIIAAAEIHFGNL